MSVRGAEEHADATDRADSGSELHGVLHQKFLTESAFQTTDRRTEMYYGVGRGKTIRQCVIRAGGDPLAWLIARIGLASCSVRHVWQKFDGFLRKWAMAGAGFHGRWRPPRKKSRTHATFGTRRRRGLIGLGAFPAVAGYCDTGMLGAPLIVHLDRTRFLSGKVVRACRRAGVGSLMLAAFVKQVH